MARVCQLTDDLKYYLCMEPVDMRKQFQGLQGIVNEEFGRYLTQDEAFIFIGKTRKTAKVLHRESDGLTLYVRKLSEGRFQMPHFNNDNRTTTLAIPRSMYRSPVSRIILTENTLRSRFPITGCTMPI